MEIWMDITGIIMIILIVLLVLVLLLFYIHVLLNHNKKAKLISAIPGPKRNFLVANGLDVMVSPAELFRLGREAANNFDGIWSFWGFGIGAVNIYNPDDVEIILSTTKYNDKSSIYLLLKPWLQEGLLLSRGSKWRQRRKILTPAFHFDILSQFAVTLEENSQRLVDYLEQNGDEVLDIVPLLSDSTLNAICETAMGVRLRDEATNKGRIYKQAIYELGKILFVRFTNIIYLFDAIFFYSPLGLKHNRCLNTIHSFTKEVIKERRELIDKHGVKFLENSQDEKSDVYVMNKRKRIAMLDLLITAEKDKLIDDSGIQEEVDTFMFEGHDTTASGLVYCLMALANEKIIQDKIVAELHEIFGDSMRRATIADLSQMRYLERCIKESMRLYPPVPFISRSINEEVVLSNYTVPKGVFCHIHIIDLHRRPDLFENPDKFDPDRFLPENCVGRHPYAYIPFSAGPRNCIGQKFAMLEMKSLIAAVLRNFELIPVTKPSDIKFECDIVLRNSGPVKVKFQKRIR